MQKNQKNFITITFIICIILFLTLIAFQFANKPLNPISNFEFQSKLDDLDFNYEILSNNNVVLNNQICSICKVISKNGYSFEFYEFDTIDDAKICYNKQENTLEKDYLQDFNGERKCTNKDTMQQFVWSRNNHYTLLKRICNTIIYVDTIDKEQDIKEINQILNNIHY